MCYGLILNKMINIERELMLFISLGKQWIYKKRSRCNNVSLIKMPEQKLLRHTNQNKCAINQILFKNDSIILSLALFIDLLNCTFILILFVMIVQE